MKGTLGDASQQALQPRRRSSGIPLCCLCARGTVTPRQRGGQRWEVMWTAEIITAKHLYCLWGRRRETASGAKYRIGIVQAGIPLPWFYRSVFFLNTWRKQINQSCNWQNKQERFLGSRKGFFFFVLFFHLGRFEMEILLLNGRHHAASGSTVVWVILISAFSWLNPPTTVSLKRFPKAWKWLEWTIIGVIWQM